MTKRRSKRRSKRSIKRKTYRRLNKKTSKRRNTRRRRSRRRGETHRRKKMRGGAEILHSKVNLGFADYSPEILDIAVKNMRHKLGEYNLRDYGFQYLDMKSQLAQLTDLEDIDPERLKQISNLLK